MGLGLETEFPFDGEIMSEPDFNALRTKRNASVQATMQKIADEEGIPITSLSTNFNPNKCYCACPDGPCEHKWDGEWYDSQDGLMQSATCSRCGTLAMSHSMGVMS